ncbi:MAG TPA: phosphoribosyltransferase [Chromatiales bacterium]|nr:phosphoribosyltransferase [Chromatiales bacterium]
MAAPVVDLPELRERTHVFADRREAGEVLARMLAGTVDADAVVVAIPAGGVPVGAALAAALGLPLDVAVVSKITLPWNTEAGYGAVAFDGRVALNEPLVRMSGLTPAEVEAGIRATREKVERRVRRLRGGEAAPDVAGREVIAVDDGLASGLTMQLAVEALRAAGARRIVVAVPTAHPEALARIARVADAVYCANVRSGPPFAVAEAYRRWYDVPEEEAAALLGR